MSNNFKRNSGYFTLTMALGVAVWMYLRVQQEELWGYLPLFLYFTIYVGSFRLATYHKDGTVIRRNYLSLASGLLLGFGFPGYIPFPFLLLGALVPLLMLQADLLYTKARWRTVFFHGFSTFVLYNLLATYWVTNTGLAAGLIAVIVNSLLMCLPWLFYHWTSKRSPSIAYLGFVGAWLSFEFLHYHWSLNWPWLTLGNGFMQFPEVVQWYEWTGVFGGSAWILGTNYLAFRFIQLFLGKILKRKITANWFPLALAVLLPIVGSLLRYYTYNASGGKVISVAAIQPNFEPHFEKFSGDLGTQLDTFTRLSNAALAAGPVDYLLYPETSFDGVEEDQANNSPSIKQLRAELNGKGARFLITGISAYHVFQPGEPLSENVRYFNRGSNGTLAFEATNGAVQVDLDDAEGAFQTYRKGIFVPGAESFPFKKVLFFMEPLVNSLGGTVAGRGTQPTRDPFTSAVADVAPVICYESVFGEYFTGYIKEGAQAIFVMTNDGWWDNTAGHRQHLWLSSLRAVETRRAVVRSANVGNCAFIDQRGRVVSRTKYNEAGYLRGELQLNDAVTLYVRFGDVIARVGLLIFAMVLLSNIARTIRPSAFEEDHG